MAKHRPIIFFGVPRSGTTLIAESIFRHPDLAYLSPYNDRFPSRLGVNRIRGLFDNPLWRIFGEKEQLNKVRPWNRFVFRLSEAYNVWEHVTGDGIDFSYGFLEDYELSETRKGQIRAYFDRVRRIQGRKRMAVKITGPSRLKFLMEVFPDAQFVRIRRNGLSTLRSLMLVDFWKDHPEGEFWWKGIYGPKDHAWLEENKGNPLAVTAYQIKRTLDQTDHEVATYRPEIFDIAYEDFVEDPLGKTQDLLEFLELKKNRTVLRKVRSVNVVKDRNTLIEEFFSEKDIEILGGIFNNPA